MPDLEFCEVCSEHPFKYKCPHCELKYCSISCFKTHIATHDAAVIPDSPASEAKDEGLESTIEAVLRPAPPPQEPASASPFTRLRDDPRLLALFTKYPDLKEQLRQVYNMTISPDNSAALLDDEDEEQDGDGDPQSGQRQHHQQQQRRPRRQNGPWNGDKADSRAVARLMKLRVENEGVAEFWDLVRMAHGDGESDKAAGITQS